MSRPAGVLLALGLTATVVRGADAQSVAELQVRVRRLESMHQAAMVAAGRADSIRQAALDTVQEGVLTVLAHRLAVPATRQGMQTVLRGVLFTYGNASNRLARGSRDVPTFANPSVGATRVVNELSRYVERAMAPERSHPWWAWAHNFIPPSSARDLADGLRQTYIDLVTAPSPATGECFAGDLAQCRVALSLVPVADPATQWYTAAARRSIVQRLLDNNDQHEHASTWRSCVRGSDDACLVAVRALNEAEMTPPLENPHRMTLLRYALQTGGPDSYLRFAETTGDMSDALARAAGMPADSVLAGWRRAVLAARPETVTTTPAAGWMAMFWATVFGMLALRSARWRRE